MDVREIVAALGYTYLAMFRKTNSAEQSHSYGVAPVVIVPVLNHPDDD